MIDLLAGSP